MAIVLRHICKPSVKKKQFTWLASLLMKEIEFLTNNMFINVTIFHPINNMCWAAPTPCIYSRENLNVKNWHGFKIIQRAQE